MGERVFTILLPDYELNGGPIGVLAATPMGPSHGCDYRTGPTTLFPESVFEADANKLARLERRGVASNAKPVIASGDPLELTMARRVGSSRSYSPSPTRMGSLARKLGAHSRQDMGLIYQVNAMHETTVLGLYCLRGCIGSRRKCWRAQEVTGARPSAPAAHHR